MLEFRKIRKDDIENALSLENECFSRPWPRSAFEEIVDKKDADYFLIEDTDNNELVAGCVVFRILDEGDITNVAVRESRRGEGLATMLIEYAIDECEELGTIDFTLEVRASNEAAIRVYEKNGFVSEGIRPGFYSAPKEDAVIMWRRQENTEC